MKIICHKSTEPTARLLAESIGCSLLVWEGRIQTLLDTLRTDTGEPSVNWGFRMKLPSHSPLNQQGLLLNAGAVIPKHSALELMRSAGVTVPPFLLGRVLLRPTMTRRGKQIEEHDGIAMQRIDKDLEFRVDVFQGKAFRFHVKTGPDDKIAWNREGTEWSTYGKKTMLRGPTEKYPTATESQVREVIALAKKAVEAIGYDFGAVDIIREQRTNKMYVLEVNSAPSLDENGVRKYASKIKRALGIATTAEDETD